MTEEIMNNEVVENVVETVTDSKVIEPVGESVVEAIESDSNVLKHGLIGGAIALGGYLLFDKVIKPKVAKWKRNRNNKNETDSEPNPEFDVENAVDVEYDEVKE